MINQLVTITYRDKPNRESGVSAYFMNRAVNDLLTQSLGTYFLVLLLAMMIAGRISQM